MDVRGRFGVAATALALVVAGGCGADPAPRTAPPMSVTMTGKGGRTIVDGAGAAPGEELTLSATNGTLVQVLTTDLTTSRATGEQPRRPRTTLRNLVPGHTYSVTVTAVPPRATAGARLFTFRFKVERARRELHFSVTPRNGARVGRHTPIVIRFSRAVAYRTNVSRCLTVAASWDPAPTEWRWTSPREIRYDPPGGWPGPNKVALDVALLATESAPGTFGAADRHVQFEVRTG